VGGVEPTQQYLAKVWPDAYPNLQLHLDLQANSLAMVATNKSKADNHPETQLCKMPNTVSSGKPACSGNIIDQNTCYTTLLSARKK